MYCQISKVCHVSLFFFHLPLIWLSDRWSLGSVLCCIHTLCVSCHYIQVIVGSSAAAWLSWPQLDNCLCFMKTEGRNWNQSPQHTPLYHDNPSIICYIACYLHNNWYLIFQPFNLKKKGSINESIWLYGVFCFSTVVKWFFVLFCFVLPWAPNHSANWSQLYRRKCKSN